MSLPSETFGGHHNAFLWVYDPVTDRVVQLQGNATGTLRTIDERQTFDSGYLKVMAVQPEGGTWAISGGVSADAQGPADVAGKMVAVLPALATAAEPTRTEGDMNQVSVDLNGRLRAVTTAPSLIWSIDYDTNHNPLYRGLAAKGSLKSQAVWQITKFTPDGSNNLTDGRFANASEAFNAIWDNRASLSYS